MKPATFSLILSGVLLNALAQLLLKAGTQKIGSIELGTSPLVATVIQVMSQPAIWAGLACYVLSVGIWIVALSRVEVSVAYPLLSIGYVVNAFAAWYLFGESLSAMRLSGIAVIIVGVVLVSRT